MKKQGAARGFPVPDVDVDGEVIELDPPRKLLQTWRMLKTLLETRASQPTLSQQPAEAPVARRASAAPARSGLYAAFMSFVNRPILLPSVSLQTANQPMLGMGVLPWTTPPPAARM